MSANVPGAVEKPSSRLTMADAWKNQAARDFILLFLIKIANEY
jgi:hypothetical protein